MGGVLATSVVALRIPQDLAGRYDRLASMTGRTKTYYLIQALAESIDRLEYEYNLMQKIEDWRAGRLQTVSLDELEADLGVEG